MRRVFATPQDVESAFYEALERADLPAMMETWSEDDDVLCVHPGGQRLVGYDQVRTSWAQILGSGERLRIRILNAVQWQSGMLSIHSVHELITVGDESKPRAPAIATNIYIRTASGWRMIVHHASPSPPIAERPADGPKIFH